MPSRFQIFCPKSRDMKRCFSLMSEMAIFLLAACGSDIAEPRLPEPIQTNMNGEMLAPGTTALASFDAHVLVLARKDYPSVKSDPLSGASPLDLAVAWGPAATSATREAVELTQSDRRYHWRARQSDMDMPGVGDFTHHSGNWHIVPASDAIAAQLVDVKPGDIVKMEGELVMLTFPDGTYYSSSLSRTDTGDGACEVFRVTKLSKEEPVA